MLAARLFSYNESISHHCHRHLHIITAVAIVSKAGQDQHNGPRSTPFDGRSQTCTWSTWRGYVISPWKNYLIIVTTLGLTARAFQGCCCWRATKFDDDDGKDPLLL
jgi:hypothetical protein